MGALDTADDPRGAKQDELPKFEDEGQRQVAAALGLDKMRDIIEDAVRLNAPGATRSECKAAALGAMFNLVSEDFLRVYFVGSPDART